MTPLPIVVTVLFPRKLRNIVTVKFIQNPTRIMAISYILTTSQISKEVILLVNDHEISAKVTTSTC